VNGFRVCNSYFSRSGEELARQQGERGKKINKTSRKSKSLGLTIKNLKTTHCNFQKDDFELANVVLGFKKPSFTLLPLDFLTRV